MLKLPWNESWNLEGLFWRPGEADQRFYGSLRHEPENGTKLHFVGSTLMDPQGRHPPAPLVPALHGESTDGVALSVLHVRPTTWTGGATNILDAVGLTVVAGSPHLTDLDATGVSRATVGLHGLRETFAGVWPYGGGILTPRDVPGGQHDQLTAELGGGARLRVEAGTVENISRGRVDPQEYANAVFEFDAPRSYSDLKSSFVEPLRDFVALATRRQSYVTRLVIACSADDLPGWRVAGMPHPRPGIEGMRTVAALAADLSAVADPADLLRRWFALRQRVGPVWTTFFSALYGSAILEDQFLSLAAFAEGYHRTLHDKPPLSKAQDRAAQRAMLDALDPDLRGLYKERLIYANAQTQRDRLSELANRAVEAVGWELDVETAVSEMIHTRNWMTHWGKRGRFAVEDPAGVLRLVRCLELIVHVNLLLDVGVDQDAVLAAVASGWRFEGVP